MRMSRTRKRRMMNQINVVPYIDVMLVLLVIFMVTAPMTNPGVVELPQVGQTLKQITQPPLVVTVKQDGQIELEGQRYGRDTLMVAIREKLGDKEQQRAIVIAADKQVKYDDVIGVMDMLKTQHIEKVGLLLKPVK